MHDTIILLCALTIKNQLLVPIGIQRLGIPHNRFCRSGGGERMRPYDYRNSGGLAVYIYE